MPIIDGYKLTMHAHCGMSYEIDRVDTDGLDRLRLEAYAYLAMREKRGYITSEIAADKWELTEPEDSSMVPDDAGILTIAPVYARTVECWNCGCEVRVGDTCDCTETNFITCAHCGDDILDTDDDHDCGAINEETEE